MANKNDVELRIRATDTSRQTFQAVAASVNTVTSALGKQIDAAQKGDESIDGLKKSLTDLKNAGTDLVRDQSLIDTFNRQAAALDAAAKKSAETAAAYEKLKTELDAADSVTKRQANSLITLEKQTNAAQAAEAKRAAALGTTVERMTAAGLSVFDLANDQQKLIETADAVGAALGAATKAVNGHSEAVKMARAAVADLVATEALQAQALAAQIKATDDAAAHEKLFQEATASNKGAQYVREYTQLLEARDAAEAKAAEASKLLQTADENAARAALQHAQAVEAEGLMIEKQYQEARKLVQASDYVNFWTQAIKDMDAAEKAAADNNALEEKAAKDLASFKKIADGANMASKGFQTFNASSGGSVGGGIGDSIRAITDPAEAARQSIDGLEQQIAGFAAQAKAGNGPVKDYAETVRGLQNAMKAIGATGDAVDAFQRQVEAVRSARSAFQAAQGDVRKYAEAIQAATVPDQELADGLKRAQQALASAGKEMQSTLTKARELQAGLQGAGVQTNNLTAESERLATMARSATGTLNSLNAAYRANGAAAAESTDKLKLFGEGQRESLSLFQRIRGEVIALSAAYIGLQGVLGLAQGALEAFVDKQAVENRLGIVIGVPDAAKIAAEYAYIHAEADRLGIGIKELADSYSRFGLAAKNANLNSDQTKFAFERITEAMRVNHSSTEAVNGAFYQLEQMLSKNKVQMDDLRQASNWIPGLEGMLSRGLGMTSVKQLFEAMKKGSVDAKTAILALGEEMERQYAKQLPDALHSLQAEQGRFATSLTDFKREIADAGFAAAYIALLQKIDTFFKSADGQNYARQLGSAFASISDVLQFVVDHIDTLQSILLALVEIKAASWAADVFGQLSRMAQAAAEAAAQQKLLAQATSELAIAYGITNAEASAMMASQQKASTSASLLATALGMVQKALIVAQVAMVGWDIGAWADRNFGAVHKYSSIIAEDFGYAWDIIRLGFERIYDGIAAKVKMLPALLGNAAKEAAAAALEANTPGDLGASAAAAIRGTKTPIPDSSVDDAAYARQFQSIQKRHQDNLAGIDRHGGFTNDGRALTTDEQQTKMKSDQAADPKGFALQKETLTEITKLQQGLNDIIDERSKKLQDILAMQKSGALSQDAAGKQSKALFDSYGPKLKAFAAQSAKDLQPMVDALGLKAPTDQLQKYQARLQGALGVYQPNLEVTTKDKGAKARENLGQTLANQLDSIQSKVGKLDIGQPIEDRLASASKSIDEQYNKIFAEIGKYQKMGGSQIGGQSISAYEGALNAQKDQLKAAAALKIELEEIKKNETEVTESVKQRTDFYKDIEDRVKAGSITPLQGMQEAADKGKDLNAAIVAATEKAKAFNEAMRGKQGVRGSLLDASNSGLARTASTAQPSAGTADVAFSTDLRATDEKGINNILKERTDITTTYNNLVKLGLSTTHDAQTTIKGEYDRTNQSLSDAADAYQKLIDLQLKDGSITPANWELAAARIKEVRSQIQYVSPELVTLQKTFTDSITKGATTAFDSAASSLAGLIDGTKSLGDSWHDFENIIGDFFSSFLKNIANAIVQLYAMQVAQSLIGTNSSGGTSVVGGLFNAAASWITGGVSHSGGDVGSGGASRAVSPAVFLNAPRYHSGTNGPLGLKADERATILQTGEKVLSRQQVAAQAQREAAMSGGGNGQPIKQILAIGDDQIQSIVNSSAGQKATLTHIRQNAETVKQFLK